MYRVGYLITYPSKCWQPSKPTGAVRKNRTPILVFFLLQGVVTKKKKIPDFQSTTRSDSSNIKDCTIFVGGNNGEIFHVNPQFSAEVQTAYMGSRTLYNDCYL
jgi:hypothetical protein